MEKPALRRVLFVRVLFEHPLLGEAGEGFLPLRRVVFVGKDGV